MRPFAMSLAALLLATAAPAFASGLPKVGSVQIGPHHVALYNDSPTLVTGANTLTVEIASLPADRAVSLSLNGPQGQVIGVPLKKVLVWDGPEGGHGEKLTADTDDHAAGPTKADGHGSSERAPDVHAAPLAASEHGAASPHDMRSDRATGQLDHGQTPAHPAAAAPAPSNEDHSAATTPYQARGTVTVPSPGDWVARLAVQDPQGAAFSGDLLLEAIEGGPDRLYLGIAGSLIAGAVLFGAIQRRRLPGQTQNAK